MPGYAPVLAAETAYDPGSQPSPGPSVQQARFSDVNSVELVQILLDQLPDFEELTPGDFWVAGWRWPLVPRPRLVPFVEARPRVDFSAADPARCFCRRASRFGAMRSGSPAAPQNFSAVSRPELTHISVVSDA